MTNSASMNTLVYVFCARMSVGYITMSPKQMNVHTEWKVPDSFPVWFYQYTLPRSCMEFQSLHIPDNTLELLVIFQSLPIVGTEILLQSCFEFP